MPMDIRTSTDKRYVPNVVLIRLREEQGWGRPRLAKQFDLIGRRHGIPTPEPSPRPWRSRFIDSKPAARCDQLQCMRSCTASHSIEPH